MVEFAGRNVEKIDNLRKGSYFQRENRTERAAEGMRR